MFAAGNAVLEAIAAINCDKGRLARLSEACRRLMTIPGVGQLTALALSPPSGGDALVGVHRFCNFGQRSAAGASLATGTLSKIGMGQEPS